MINVVANAVDVVKFNFGCFCELGKITKNTTNKTTVIITIMNVTIDEIIAHSAFFDCKIL